ncbi:hypothetical protein CEXT_320211 [Caerostris extrusa]|uniref:Uncharacterized protein n=1 Tax=Caerostris extrusa TaxID=172846 RepID=A0AAV4X1K9_CAEEX|nr:hypothetical protein CEXT_320211 [Caerostris extrusa]
MSDHPITASTRLIPGPPRNNHFKIEPPSDTTYRIRHIYAAQPPRMSHLMARSGGVDKRINLVLVHHLSVGGPISEGWNVPWEVYGLLKWTKETWLVGLEE